MYDYKNSQYQAVLTFKRVALKSVFNDTVNDNPPLILSMASIAFPTYVHLIEVRPQWLNMCVWQRPTQSHLSSAGCHKPPLRVDNRKPFWFHSVVINRLYSAGISGAHRGRPVTFRTARSKSFVLSCEGDVDSFMTHFVILPSPRRDWFKLNNRKRAAFQREALS